MEKQFYGDSGSFGIEEQWVGQADFIEGHGGISGDKIGVTFGVKGG